MATKKKTTAKKRPAARASSASTRNKTTTKRAPAKAQTMQSFRVAPNVPPFYTFKFTVQTFYWLVLLAVIVVAHIYLLGKLEEIAQLTEALVQQNQL